MSLTGNQLRQKYLQFFQDRGHAIVPSARLVPENDPTTLFTSAGMQPMMPYLLGAKHPEGSRIVDSQKSFRANDIEEVGDNRHTTFFEMLGNWSLGDYFKQEQLTWFFEFLTQEVGLDPHRLYVSVFAGSDQYQISKDETAVGIWQELFAQRGIEAEVVTDPQAHGSGSDIQGRIFYYDVDKNWWSRAGEPKNMPVGEPGGPDSEVFYDFGSDLKIHEQSSYADQPCHINCDCGRFLEIGNSVFMQYQKTEQGFKPLKQKNIDFGGGLERILAAKQQTPDIFKTDLFWPIIGKLQSLAEQPYSQTRSQSAYRIITDHLKAAVMLIGDGVKPGNKDQGYVVRRLIRRASRQGKLIGLEEPFLSQLVAEVVKIYQQPYSYLVDQQQEIETVIGQEEDRFERTVHQGLKEFKKAVDSKQTLTGKLAFKLYQTYGFPLEMSIEEARLQKLTISDQLRQEFEKAQEVHAEKSRSGSEEKFQGGLADQTAATTRYHTATHLIQAALRKVLGDHVKQKGSNITAERLRFDFSHTENLTAEEIKQVEQLVNRWVEQDLPVTKQIMSKQEALNSGALAVFVDRYPDQVSVYTVQAPVSTQETSTHEAADLENVKTEAADSEKKSWVSREFCGGPHVESTGEIGAVEIYKEQSAGSGIRRIYARCKN